MSGSKLASSGRAASKASSPLILGSTSLAVARRALPIGFSFHGLSQPGQPAAHASQAGLGMPREVREESLVLGDRLAVGSPAVFRFRLLEQIVARSADQIGQQKRAGQDQQDQGSATGKHQWRIPPF